MMEVKDAGTNCPFLSTVEDGLVMRETGAWAAQKLDYLCRYLNIFTISMQGKQWRGLHFIDLFSGPGKCKIRGTKQILLGSPLLAVNLQHPFNRYFFVDMNQEAISSLRTRCDASINAANIQYEIGDSNLLVENIADQIKAIDRPFIKGKWVSLNLAFLDPEGFELEWKTVTILGNIKKMDLIIYYPQMGLSREMPKEFQNPNLTKIDSYFGGRQWREIYKKYQSGQIQYLHRSLLDLYKENLKSLGYVTIEEDEPLLRNTRRKAPLYRLIFASKNQLGNKFWKQVTNRDVFGQAKLC